MASGRSKRTYTSRWDGCDSLPARFLRYGDRISTEPYARDISKTGQLLVLELHSNVSTDPTLMDALLQDGRKGSFKSRIIPYLNSFYDV